MSQQLSPSSQFGPFNGGAIEMGCRVCTVTGAMFSVSEAGISGGDGSVTEIATVWLSSAGTVSSGSTATSSHT